MKKDSFLADFKSIGKHIIRRITTETTMFTYLIPTIDIADTSSSKITNMQKRTSSLFEYTTYPHSLNRNPTSLTNATQK